MNKTCHYVYILQSLKDQRTYVGCTSNLEQRLKQHSEGKAIATRNRRPLEILWVENFTSLREARKREHWWKSGGGRRKLREFFKEKCIVQ